MAKRALGRPLILAVAFLLIQAAAAGAWEWPTCRSNKRVWDGSTVTFAPSNVSFPAGSAWRTSIEAVRTAWNTAPGTNFRFNYAYNNATNHNSGDGTNGVLITSGYGWGTTTLAVALTRYRSCIWPFWNGKIDEVDVLFNPAFFWDTSTNPAALPTEDDFFFNSTIVGIHEFGHAFGLDHENDLVATMNATYPDGGPLGNAHIVQPHADDVGGNRSGYGTSGSPRDVAASPYQRHLSGRSRPIPAPPVLFRNTPTNFPFTVENRGTWNETSVGVKFYLSTDRNITTGDFYVGQVGLAMNAAYTGALNASITVPASVPAGNYFFGYIVDPENYIGEVDEANNAAAYAGTTQVSNLSPPTACMDPSWVSGYEPLYVTLDGSCSSDSDGSIVSYQWDMGDGSFQFGPTINHNYWTYGYYTITLTVTDNSGLSSTTWGTADVWCVSQGGEICQIQ